MTEERAVDIALLKRFTPLMGMKQRNLASLAGKVVVRQLEAGRVLLREGDVDSRTYWIVSGTVELRRGTQAVAMISGGSDAATLPLAPSNPRVYSVRAVENIEYLAIESELLDVMITWDQTGTYEVAELQARHRERLLDGGVASNGRGRDVDADHPAVEDVPTGRNGSWHVRFSSATHWASR
jgi:CRP-like cAMP-binding protein